jgi:hypothetical protein
LHLIRYINPDFSKTKKFYLTGIYIDTDVTVNNAALMVLEDQQDAIGSMDVKLMFNAQFYKSSFLDFSSNPLEFVGIMQLDVTQAVTGIVTLSLFGYWNPK